MRSIVATYRLQLTREFTLPAARAVVPYLAELGVSHVYLSPVLAARPASAHGYDVVDHARINPELGSEDDLRALARDLHERSMGIVLDIVPNHMAATSDNPYWDDVLLRGRSSRYADWFDVDWDAPGCQGKVVLPVLGDDLDRVLERGEVTLRIRDTGCRVAYFDKTFPLDPATLPRELQLAHADPAGRPEAEEFTRGNAGRQRLRRLLDDQRYRLRFWRKGAHEINYRRFFEVNDLVSVRMEHDGVFAATHARILAWVREGLLDGLRIDHVDGLRDPLAYLTTLRGALDAETTSGAQRCAIFVEKILTDDETLPGDWPVEGTTGYDFLNDVEDVFIDPAGFRAIEDKYRALRHRPRIDFRSAARDGKRRVLSGPLRSDVARLARVAHAWRPDVAVAAFQAAIVEVIVHLAVYRTYLTEAGAASDADRARLASAIAGAREHDVDTNALAALEESFLGAPTDDPRRQELVMRFQQTSGPAAAKGVEDTALYAYMPLASRNEVGAKPDRDLEGARERLHARNLARRECWPRTMLATNTHDTKRSADLRSRLDVLAAMPEPWSRHVARWRRLNRPRKRVAGGKPAPDPNSEYLYYQTLLGLWPAPRPGRRVDDLPGRDWLTATRHRLVAYMLKAAREAKTRTSWTESDAQFEQALDGFVRASLDPADDAPFLGDVARLTAQVAADGFRFALARLLVHLTAPGIPDIYQGDELWNFTLVDPDNRRPVDFARRAQLARESSAPSLGDAHALHLDQTKLALLARVLRFRRANAALFLSGSYHPLIVDEAAGPRLFAFERRRERSSCIVLARTRACGAGADSRSVRLPGDLAGAWRSVLTDRAIELVRVGGHVEVSGGDLVPVAQPCELLARPNA